MLVADPPFGSFRAHSLWWVPPRGETHGAVNELVRLREALSSVGLSVGVLRHNGQVHSRGALPSLRVLPDGLTADWTPPFPRRARQYLGVQELWFHAAHLAEVHLTTGDR